MTPVDQLTDEQIRVEIAEWEGWRCGDNKNIPFVYGIPPEMLGIQPEEAHYVCIPDYPEDLTACHIAEAKLPSDQFPRYLHYLWKCTASENRFDIENQFYLCHATARQRAIALVMTIREHKK